MKIIKSKKIIFKFSTNKQKIIFLFNKFIIFILIILYFIILLILNILSLKTISELLNLNNDKNFKFIWFFCLCICILGLIFNIISIIIIYLISYEEFINYKLQFIILNIISFNFFCLIYNIIIYSFEIKKKYFLFVNISKWKKFLINLGIWKWKTFDIIIISIFIAKTLIFSYLETLLLNLLYGGGIGLKYITIISISFLHSVIAGFLTGSISSLLSLLFISSNFIISPWSYLLDYFIPMIIPSISGFMRFNIKNKKKYIIYINYIIICFTVVIFIYLSQILSGILIWINLFPNLVWKNYNNLLYVIIYNFIHIFIFTYPIIQIIIPFILQRLSPIFWKYYLKYDI